MLIIPPKTAFLADSYYGAISQTESENLPVFDFHGNEWTNLEYKKRFYLKLKRDFSINKNSQIPFFQNSTEKELIKFESFNSVAVSNGHFQLHDCLKLISQNKLVYPSQNSINCFNLKTEKSTNIMMINGIYTFDVDPSLQFISGVSRSGLTADISSTFLYDVKNQKHLMKRPAYRINNIVGKNSFIKSNGLKLFASGNAKYGVIIDIEKDFAETKIVTDDFINNHLFDEKSQLVGLCLDNGHVQFSDSKCKNPAFLVKVHEGYALAIDHLDSFYWCSGGQDYSFKIFDIRKPDQFIFEKSNLQFVTTQIKSADEGKSIFLLGMNISLNCLQITKEEVFTQQVDFLGANGGMAVDDISGKLFVSHWSSPSRGISTFNFRTE